MLRSEVASSGSGFFGGSSLNGTAYTGTALNSMPATFTLNGGTISGTGSAPMLGIKLV